MLKNIEKYRKILSSLLILSLLVQMTIPIQSFAGENSMIISSGTEEDMDKDSGEIPLKTDLLENKKLDESTSGNELATELKDNLLGLNIVHKAYLNKNRKLLTERFSGEISLSPSSVGELKDYVIEIKIPKEYLDEDRLPTVEAGNVGASQDLVSVQIENVGIVDDNYELRVHLLQVPDTIQMSFTYGFSLIPRLTPENFSVTPIISLYEKKDNDTKLIKELSNVSFRAKYNVIVDFDKSIMQHDENYDRTYRDALHLLPYAGKNENGFLSKQIDELKEVPFYYSFSTTAKGSSGNEIRDEDNETVFANRQSYGDGLNNTRFAEQIKLIEKLTYTGSDGKKYKAYFEAASNPGWELQSDGESVVYTANAQGDVSADQIIYKRPVVLKLKFPEAPVVRPGAIGNATLLSNRVIAEIIPRNYDAQLEQIREMQDEIAFKFFADNFNLNGVFIKGNLESQHKEVFLGFTHSNEANTRFILKLNNISGQDMKKMVIEDYDFDEVFYLRKLILKNSSSMNPSVRLSDIENIKLVYEDRTEKTVPLPQNLNAQNEPILLDMEAENRILSQVGKVFRQERTRELAKEELKNIPVASKLIITMKDDFVLRKGQTMEFEVQMGIRNPFAFMLNQQVKDEWEQVDIYGNPLEKFDKPIDNSQRGTQLTTQAFNHGKVQFDVESIGVRQEISSKSYVRFSGKQSTISIQKSNVAKNPDNSKDYRIGSKVLYRVNVDLSSVKPDAVFQDAYFVDLLPEGLEVLSIFHNDHSFKGHTKNRKELFSEWFGFERYNSEEAALPENLLIVPNYQNTGKTAIILKAKKSWVVDDLLRHSRGIGFVMECRITESASAENTNEVYFTASNLEEIFHNLNANRSSKVENFHLIYPLGKEYTKALMTTSSFDLQISNSIIAEKFISSNKNEWTKSKLHTDFDVPFYYKIRLTNKTNRLSDIVIYDVFPKTDDKNYNNQTKRQSQFSNQLFGKVELSEEQDKIFDVFYLDVTPSFDANEGIKSTHWKSVEQIGDDFAKVQAIKIQIKPGKQLKKAQYEFVIPMKTPPKEANLYKKEATNNFVILYKGKTGGLSNSVSNVLPPEIKPIEKIDIKVIKEWSGQKGESANIRLFANHTEVADVLLNEYNDWTHIFRDLPKTDSQGQKIFYRVIEEDVEGYTKLIKGDAENGFIVTNTQVKSSGQETQSKSSVGGLGNKNHQIRADEKIENERNKSLSNIRKEISSDKQYPSYSTPSTQNDFSGNTQTHGEGIDDGRTPLSTQEKERLEKERLERERLERERRKKRKCGKMRIEQAPKTGNYLWMEFFATPMILCPPIEIVEEKKKEEL